MKKKFIRYIAVPLLAAALVLPLGAAGSVVPAAEHTRSENAEESLLDDFAYPTAVTPDAPEGEKELTGLDGEKLPWVAASGGDGITLSVAGCDDLEGADRCLSVQGRMGFANAVERTFAEPLDLRRYRGLSLFFYGVLPEGADEALCAVTLVLRTEETSKTLSLTCAAGEWQVLRFDLSDFDGRGEITRISASVRIAADTARDNDSFRLARLSAEDGVSQAVYDRFLTDAWTTDSEARTPDAEDGLTYTPSADGALCAALPALCDRETDGVWLVLENSSTADRLTFSWRGTEEEFSDDRSVTFKLSPSSPVRAYYAPAPGIDAARVWRISADGGTEGTLRFRVVNPVALASEPSSPPGLSLGTLSSVKVSDGGRYLRVSGTMTAEAVSRFSGRRIGLYALPVGESTDPIRNGERLPVATMPISMRFDFKLPLGGDNSAELSKQYIVVIMDEVDESGELFTVGTPHFVSPSNATETSSGTGESSGNTEQRLDGLVSPDPSAVVAAGAGFTVLEVDCGRLQAAGGIGTLFKADGMYRYYNSAYLAELDRSVCTLSTGGEVLLRLVMETENRDEALTCAPENENARYYALTASDAERSENLFLLSGFLASRYAPDGECGEISGMILGHEADRPDEMNYAGELSVAGYTALYADTLRVLWSGAARYNSALEFYAAVGGELRAASPVAGGSTALPFIEALSAAMASRGSCAWRLSVETTADPLDPASDGFCTAASQTEFSAYLTEIDDRTGCAPAALMLLWTPDGTEERAESYVYSLLTLAAGTVERFAICVEGGAEDMELLEVLDEGYFDDFVPGEALAASLAASGRELPVLTAALEQERLHRSRFSCASELPVNVIGEHRYFDFTASYDTGGWVAGENCELLSSVSAEDGRLLCATLNSTGRQGYMGILYRFDYSENFSVAPHVGFVFDLPHDAAPLEVTVIFGASGSRAEFSGVVSPGESRLLCDLTGYGDRAAIDYLRIFVRDTGSDCTLRMASVTGYSSYYTSESLATVISNQRAEMRAQHEETSGFGRTAVTVALLALAVFTVAVVLMLSRRREQVQTPTGDDRRR